MADTIIATNRKALADYTILESVEAGLALKGAEVKSLRARLANLRDSFARPQGREIYLHNMHISPYEFSAGQELDPVRPRKLLLHRSQINRIIANVAAKRLALVPLRLYFKGGIAKVELALAKGKRQYDKRDAIRRREMERELRRAAKERS